MVHIACGYILCLTGRVSVNDVDLWYSQLYSNGRLPLDLNGGHWFYREEFLFLFLLMSRIFVVYENVFKIHR